MKEELAKKNGVSAEPKFKEGDIVYERIRPTQKLIVKSSKGLIYSCMPIEHPNQKELSFFERELIGSPHSKELSSAQ